MKHIKTILILVLLIGLPAMSWYFLQSGLDWRKSKVSDLKNKGLFLNSFDFANSDKDVLYELMAHRTSVVKVSDMIDENDELIIDQFKNAHTFQFISFEKSTNNKQGWNSKSVVRYYKPSSHNTLLNSMKESIYMLVDTSGQIRQFYTDNSEQTLGYLVEDIAVILPRKKSKDIVIKKN